MGERLARLFSTSRQHRGTQTAKDPMACETEKLAFDIIYYNLGKRSPSQNDDDVVKCLRQCVSQMLENHSIIFNRIISRIDLHQNTDFQKGFYVVSEELFQGQVSWGRIVSLFAYGHDYEGKIWRSLVLTGMSLTAIATFLALQRSS